MQNVPSSHPELGSSHSREALKAYGDYRLPKSKVSLKKFRGLMKSVKDIAPRFGISQTMEDVADSLASSWGNAFKPIDQGRSSPRSHNVNVNKPLPLTPLPNIMTSSHFSLAFIDRVFQEAEQADLLQGARPDMDDSRDSGDSENPGAFPHFTGSSNALIDGALTSSPIEESDESMVTSTAHSAASLEVESPGHSQELSSSSESEFPSFARPRKLTTANHPLRRNQYRQARRISDVAHVRECDATDEADHRDAVIQVEIQPNEQDIEGSSMYVRVARTTELDAILSSICEARSMPNEEYTFVIPGIPVAELDRNIQYVLERCGGTTFIVTKGTRSYSTRIVCEEGEDVMIVREEGEHEVVMAGTVPKLVEQITPEDEDKTDPPLLRLVGEFLDALQEYRGSPHLPLDFTEECTRLRAIMEEQIKLYTKHELNRSLDHKVKVLPGLREFFLGISPEDLAKQLCLFNHRLFRNVNPTEYLDFIWKLNVPEDSPTGMSPILSVFVERFNRESLWVATVICSVAEERTRRRMLKKFVWTAKCCAELNNFFSAFAILGGLNHAAVRRLKRTRDIGDKYVQAVAELDMLCDPSRNMKRYRERLAACTPPAIPFIALFFKDLTFLNDGNKSHVDSMVNFDKLRMMAAWVNEVRRFAESEYSYDEVVEVRNYIACLPVVDDPKKLMQMSSALER
ncbi:ras GEF [Gonapodya prolifera JEL478]|uniref:Ras GEF n=1 Tax=Gonapodya prolifera (strain JEL478) TaxID=1344416 RepID=A0A139AAN2_GONPJ|nr:ras GEF [Gonapodya prolifera JEL478]|eukprot:KXS13881.1 ras GEF [Gonapodya prolifera JEL478]